MLDRGTPLARLRANVARQITENYMFVDLTEEGTDAIVLFRIAADPQLYGVRVPAERLPSAASNAGLDFELMSELDTGLRERGHRVARATYTELVMYTG